MAKKKDSIKLKEVKITAKSPKSVLKSGGEVSTRRIDSIKRANPAAARAIGKGFKGSGGMTTYGDDASDVIKSQLKGGLKNKR